jgi:carboxymethylenebutenolidase
MSNDPTLARKIELTASDGHRLTAWRCEPRGMAYGGVVVLHAVYGLTDHMADVCRRWAEAGYTAVAPALFDRLGSNIVHPYDRPGDGAKCYNALSEEQIMADIEAASNATGAPGHVVISGFCTGGTWAWHAAARAAFAAQVNFYGSAIPARLDMVPMCPTILHYGDNDHVVSVAMIDQIRERRPDVELHVYPGAGHAFVNNEQATFNANAADLAWSRSLAFLEHHLKISKAG